MKRNFCVALAEFAMFAVSGQSTAEAEDYRFRVLFDRNSTAPVSAYANVAAIQSEVALICGPTTITIDGHADTSEDNAAALSLSRAETIRLELVKSGVSPSLMTTNGLGDGSPEIATADNVPEQKNRRVEVTIACTAPLE